MDMRILLTTVILCHVVKGNYPVFDYRTRMRILLLPADARPGSVIYRLRGTDSDYDYPLRFDVADDIGKSIIKIENMPCTPTHTYCQANVILTKKLEAGRVYDLTLSLKDSSGRETKVDSMIRAMRASSHFDDAFPYVPNVLMVPESTPVGTVLDFVLARKSPKSSQHAYLELWGSEKFRIVQNLSTKDLTNGSITLAGTLDFEEKNMYMLQIYSLDPYTEPGEDTRNIAGFNLAVVVEDEQDMAPVFHSVPPVTSLRENLTIGEQILQIQAEDGDRGNPRAIRYSFPSENNIFSSYFNISEKTGEIILARPFRELVTAARASQPILLTVAAEEVKTKMWEPPAMISITQVAFIFEKNIPKTPPYFSNNEYVARISENALQGTSLVFSEAYATLIRDDTLGQGVFSLTLDNNNGTFEISPTIGERRTNFVIRVRNNEMLDFEERTYVTFMIIARELSADTGDSSKPLISKANVTVYIDDENDNFPVFLQDRYEVVIAENVTAGTVVTQVQATDLDTGSFGKIHYTNIISNPNNSLNVDSTTGVITVATNNHGFDREAAEEYRLTVEARDLEGFGNRVTVPLIIRLLDVNDETPQFERQVFEFILQPNLRNFTNRAFIKATDKDAEEPNNIVRYEIMSGNYENKFYLDEVSGELFVRGKLSKPRARSTRQIEFQEDYYNNNNNNGGDGGFDSAIVLTVRAYDLGIPHRWQHAHVRIYPPESKARNMSFIVSGSNPDRRTVEELLKQITGGRVIIHDIRPYTGQEPGTDVSWRQARMQPDKSIVVATVFYEGGSYVDINKLEERLTANKTQALVKSSVTEYKQENNLLFWLMMFFLILMLIILLILILCCIWQGCCVCPCCVIDPKNFRIIPSENIKFIAHERGQETKGVQAVLYPERREAWSGHQNERLYQTQMVNVREKTIRNANSPLSDGVAAGVIEAGVKREEIEKGGPNIIYTREFLKKERHPTMMIEDVETDPYNSRTYTLKSKTDEKRNESGDRLKINKDNDPDSDSMVRHEMERGSDLGKASKDRSKDMETIDYRRIELDRGLEIGIDGIKQYRVVLERPKGTGEDLSEDEIIDLDRIDANRDQYYIRDGNAEILRLVTRGNQEDRPNTLVQEKDRTLLKLDNGKEIIMKRFMEDQRQNSDLYDEIKQELIRQLRRESDRNSSLAKTEEIDLKEYIAQLVYQGRNEFGNRNFDREVYSFNNQETQSLPGQMEISTQTERDLGTQTEKLSSLRPPRRKVRSDNEFSDEDEDDDEDEEDEFYEDGKIDIAKAVTALNLGKGWIKRNGRNYRFKKPKRYKIKTPILEEADSPNESSIKYDTRPAMFKMPEFGVIVNGTGPGAYTENKSSILRRRKMKERITEESGNEVPETRKKDKTRDKDNSSDEEYEERSKSRKSRRDLMENKNVKVDQVNAARKRRAESLNRLYQAVKELQDQELELESRQRTSSLNRLYNVLREIQQSSSDQAGMKKTRSLTNLTSTEKKPKTKARSRTPTESAETSFEDAENRKETSTKRKHSSNARHRLVEKIRIRESVSEPPKSDQDIQANLNGSMSVDEIPKDFKSNKSKYMDWYRELNEKRIKKRQLKKKGKKAEDDLDSGIAMSNKPGGKAMSRKNQQFLEKKSIFTIAYDEVQTKNIRPDTNASQKY